MRRDGEGRKGGGTDGGQGRMGGKEGRKGGEEKVRREGGMALVGEGERMIKISNIMAAKFTLSFTQITLNHKNI